MQHEIHQALVEEFNRRVFRESIPRIKKCLNVLTEDEIWQSPGATLSSIGNLVLHLCGNARQWICSGLGKQTDLRKRSLEFESGSRCSKSDLLEKLNILQKDLSIVLNHLPESEWLSVRPVQGFRENGLSILIHVIEHFSYHTGQISAYTKQIKSMDLGYYEGLDLNQK